MPRPLRDRTCVQCGGTFPSRTPDVRFCSKRCAAAALGMPPVWSDEARARQAQARQARLEARIRPCAGCGTAFAPADRNQRYCTARCTTANGPWSFKAFHGERAARVIGMRG